MTLKFDGWPWKTTGTFSMLLQALCVISKPSGNSNKSYSPENQFGSKLVIFCSMWPWNLMDDLENNRAPLLYYIKLCASFHSHQWIQTGVIVQKRSIRVKIGNCFPFDLEIWQLTSNNTNLRDFIAVTSLVISNKIQIDFSARVTLKFDRWPQEKIRSYLFYIFLKAMCHFIAIH